MNMKRKIEIDGMEIEITAHAVNGGSLFHCFDTYGEPCTTEQFFATAREAMDNREASIRKMMA